MKDMMSVSGTHDNNPFNFVEAAINKTENVTATSYPKLAVYYFYTRCEQCKGEIDNSFSFYLGSDVAGDSVNLGDDDTLSSSVTGGITASSTKRRKMASPDDDHFAKLVGISERIATCMEEDAQQKKEEVQRRNRKEEVEAFKIKLAGIDLSLKTAQMMNDVDAIKELCAELKELRNNPP